MGNKYWVDDFNVEGRSNGSMQRPDKYACVQEGLCGRKECRTKEKCGYEGKVDLWK